MIWTNWRKRYEEKCKESDFHKRWANELERSSREMLIAWADESNEFRDLVRDFAQYRADIQKTELTHQLAPQRFCELLQRASDLFPEIKPTDYNEPEEQR